MPMGYVDNSIAHEVRRGYLIPAVAPQQARLPSRKFSVWTGSPAQWQIQGHASSSDSARRGDDGCSAGSLRRISTSRCALSISFWSIASNRSSRQLSPRSQILPGSGRKLAQESSVSTKQKFTSP